MKKIKRLAALMLLVSAACGCGGHAASKLDKSMWDSQLAADAYQLGLDIRPALAGGLASPRAADDTEQWVRDLDATGFSDDEKRDRIDELIREVNEGVCADCEEVLRAARP
jgi:hypothetical protein